MSTLPVNNSAWIDSDSRKWLTIAVGILNTLVLIVVCVALFIQDDRQSKIETAMTGQFRDWENRVPLTEQVETANKLLLELQADSKDFIVISRGALEAIQEVAQIQVGRGSRVRTLEKSDASQKSAIKTHSKDIAQLKKDLADIQWILETRKPDPKEKPRKALLKSGK